MRCTTFKVVLYRCDLQWKKRRRSHDHKMRFLFKNLFIVMHSDGNFCIQQIPKLYLFRVTYISLVIFLKVTLYW